MKKFLLFAAIAATMLNVNAQYKVEKLWGSEDVPAAADCRQGIGLNGKFYINHKGLAANEETGQEAVDPYVMVYGEGGLANEQFPGGPNCGISIDQAGHLIVSLATFPGAASWIFDDETAMIRVIDPATAEVTDLPLGGGAPNEGRLDVLGRAYGDLLGEGELYLPTIPAAGSINRYFYEDGEVLGEDCYKPMLNPAPNADNMTIINAVVDADGNDAIFYYQRGGMPYLYYWNGDNLEGEAINIPAAENGMIRCNQNGADFFAFNGKNFVVYPLGEANNSYFDGFAIYEIGAEAPFFVKEPTIAAAANGFQANWLNAEITEDGVLIYQYAPGKSMEVYKLSLEAEETNVYILGSVNGNQWDPSVGVPMDYADGEYTADIAVEDEFGYFSFTKKLAENSGDWDAIAPYRFTAVSDGDFIMTDELYGQPITLDEDGVNYNNAIKIPAGSYKLVVNLETRGRTLVITKNEPTAVENIDVTKTVARVNYINAAGQISATPFEGINVMVTTYTDGSKATSKVVK